MTGNSQTVTLCLHYSNDLSFPLIIGKNFDLNILSTPTNASMTAVGVISSKHFSESTKSSAGLSSVP